MKSENTYSDSGTLIPLASSQERQTSTGVQHMQAPSPLINPDSDGMTTGEFAAVMKLQSQSIRKRYSQTGSYYDVKPFKLPNGRLRWPINAVMQLVNNSF
jgi:hypothetical protein